MENILESKESMNKINKLNEKLQNIKLNQQEHCHRNNFDTIDNDLVRIKESPLKPEAAGKSFLKETNDKKVLNSQSQKIPIYNNVELNPDDSKSHKNTIDGNNKNNIFLFNQINKDHFLSNNANRKTNIFNSIHYNSDIRMKRYEILLDFISSNMKEIEKMVIESSKNELAKATTEAGKPDIINNKNQQFGSSYSPDYINSISNQETMNKQINFTQQDYQLDNKNNCYASYLNSLKKIEETNSNKASSLHSKINLNSRLSNNDNMLDDSEMKENREIYNAQAASNLINNYESAKSNRRSEYLAMVNNQGKDINLNNPINYNNLTNIHSLHDHESINFYNNKKEPGSSLLISSIYSDFYQDIIDESFNNLNLLMSNNMLNLINNNNRHSPIIPNTNFQSNNNDCKNNLNTIFNNPINNEINNNNILNQKFSNIISMNNNFNKLHKQQPINPSHLNELNSNDKENIPYKNAVSDNRIKNNLDKNLLSLMNDADSNNKIISSEQTMKKIIDPSNQEINSEQNKNYFNNNSIKQPNKSEINHLFTPIDNNLLEFTHKESTDINMEKEITINPIKNIENKMKNINSLNCRLNGNRGGSLALENMDANSLNKFINIKKEEENYNATDKDCALRLNNMNNDYNIVKHNNQSNNIINNDNDRTMIQFEGNLNCESTLYKFDHENFNTQNEKYGDEKINTDHLTNKNADLDKTKININNNQYYNYK